MVEEMNKQPDQGRQLPDIGDGVTLIDFNAAWCVPCREQGPIVEKIADKFRGKAFVYNLNVDDHPDPALSLGITSIPTLIVFKNGNECERFIGIQTEETLTRALEKALREQDLGGC
ncbi:MAG: thioredoxin domain-containing protein [bacterium]